MAISIEDQLADIRSSRTVALFSRKASSIKHAVSVLISLTLAACGHTPVTRTLWTAVSGGIGPDLDQFQLNPSLRYLRVSTGGRTALMVLGYVEPDPAGDIEVWYSSEGEVLRIQHGRIIGTAGLVTNWSAVRPVSVPKWKDVLSRPAWTYERERDEMPGYRFGISERVALYPVEIPNNAKLFSIRADSLRWYEEAVPSDPDGLPSARYGLGVRDGQWRVVYGEQCLAKGLCLAWQIWPPSS